MQLTKAEEQIMQILWTIEEGTVQDITQKFDTNKTARTTIATVCSILENQEFVEYLSEGRTDISKAIVSKEKYLKKQLIGVVKEYFNGSR